MGKLPRFAGARKRSDSLGTPIRASALSRQLLAALIENTVGSGVGSGRGSKNADPYKCIDVAPSGTGMSRYSVLAWIKIDVRPPENWTDHSA